MLLQRQPNQKAADLAKALGVSIRSLHRYVGMLDEMGVPVYSERGPYGGFSLVRGYRMPPLVFTPEEAVAVYLGASMVPEIWGRLYGEAARGALAKLDNVLPEAQLGEVAWARKSLVATGMHRAHLDDLGPCLESLRGAIREQRRVRIVYRNANTSTGQPRQVDPYALVHRWGWWYLFGLCHLRRAIRSFRLDRIDDLRVLDKTFAMPDDFDVRAQMAKGFESQSSIMMRMRFSPLAANVDQQNRAYWDKLEEQPDGSVIVTMTMPDLMWGAATAMAYGPIVVVLEPPELRAMVRDWATAVAAQYPEAKISDNEPAIAPIDSRLST
jgi:predicted DNA-binding transcriptional regulator YafY